MHMWKTWPALLFHSDSIHKLELMPRVPYFRGKQFLKCFPTSLSFSGPWFCSQWNKNHCKLWNFTSAKRTRNECTWKLCEDDGFSAVASLSYGQSKGMERVDCMPVELGIVTEVSVWGSWIREWELILEERFSEQVREFTDIARIPVVGPSQHFC